MSALTRFSLKNRALIALITLFVFLGGIFTSGALRRELIPSLELPVVAVLTPVPGSSSNVIEEQVSRPLEAAILAVPNIKKVQSTSGDSTSSILVTFEYGTNLPDTQARIQRAVLGVPNLPEGSSPTVITGSIADFPIMQLSASGALHGDALAQRLRDHVIPTLEDIPGVRSVTISGIGVQNVSISLNKNKMKDAGLTTASVTAALQASGVTIPGGFPTKPTPTAPTVTQLGDIATIAFTPSDNISIARTNGKPSIALSVVKKPDASTVDISHAITDKLPQLSTRIPNGSMNVVFDQAPYIEQSIDDLLHEGLLGLGMAVLVVFTFLLSIRLTLVTAVSIPASLMVAMIGLKASNNTLNILTLGALTIAIGRVVDDSIVVVENIARKLDLGLPRIEAITTAVREVAGAVTASTIVTVAVFLPIGVVGGQAGELFRPFAITVGIAMLASLL
ncbi:efflux RND transporter permease subunit, partial [Dermatophilus congolensis]|uniref:efflux RND transporter permease subunit n=1 Tax=Dermatophilus congolensis TaxID=1863 RepID=UPI001AAE53AE|nr:efflux RND transporter permease subunit [Dermatophilus congolensis]